METLRELRHRLDHVNGNADRVRAGPRCSPCNRLTDPPRRVGTELETAAVFVLVHGPHEAGVAFLNQVQERQSCGCGTSWRWRRRAASCRRKARPALGLLVLRTNRCFMMPTRLRRLDGSSSVMSIEGPGSSFSKVRPFLLPYGAVPREGSDRPSPCMTMPNTSPWAPQDQHLYRWRDGSISSRAGVVVERAKGL